MDLARNLFTPGAGRMPPALVGRASDIEAGQVVIDRTAGGLTAQGLMLSGLRGVGKTVLLRELQTRTDSADWLTIDIEGKRD